MRPFVPTTLRLFRRDDVKLLGASPMLALCRSLCSAESPGALDPLLFRTSLVVAARRARSEPSNPGEMGHRYRANRRHLDRARRTLPRERTSCTDSGGRLVYRLVSLPDRIQRRQRPRVPRMSRPRSLRLYLPSSSFGRRSHLDQRTLENAIRGEQLGWIGLLCTRQSRNDSGH
jgi:hypothetical protein